MGRELNPQIHVDFLLSKGISRVEISDLTDLEFLKSCILNGFECVSICKIGIRTPNFQENLCTFILSPFTSREGKGLSSGFGYKNGFGEGYGFSLAYGDRGFYYGYQEISSQIKNLEKHWGEWK